MKLLCAIFTLSSFIALSTAWPKYGGCPQYSGTVFHDTAPNRHGLKHTIDTYRAALGGSDNGNNPGPLSHGHRSINWDAEVVPFNMPFDFFKTTVTRGAEFHTFGNNFAVSNPAPTDPSGTVDDRFSSIDNKFRRIFKTFSPKRLFTPVDSNDVTAIFSIPAVTHQRAEVSGFGAIFTNVVVMDQTRITYFDKDNCPIVTVAAQPEARGLSFAGIVVTHKDGNPVQTAVASVRMILGNAALSEPFRRWKNFVVLDDLIYGEPQPL